MNNHPPPPATATPVPVVHYTQNTNPISSSSSYLPSPYPDQYPPQNHQLSSPPATLVPPVPLYHQTSTAYYPTTPYPQHPSPLNHQLSSPPATLPVAHYHQTSTGYYPTTPPQSSSSYHFLLPSSSSTQPSPTQPHPFAQPQPSPTHPHPFAQPQPSPTHPHPFAQPQPSPTHPHPFAQPQPSPTHPHPFAQPQVVIIHQHFSAGLPTHQNLQPNLQIQEQGPEVEEPDAQLGIEDEVKQGEPKTELCRHFARLGRCNIGSDCYFAHGLSELRRVTTRHPLYRTRWCDSVLEGHPCTFGQRCSYRHY